MMLVGRNVLAPAFAGLLMAVAAGRTAWGHAAAVELGHDPAMPFYTGTANPGGTASSIIITTAPMSPSFLNGIGGGIIDGAAGEFGVTPTMQNLVLVGLALHVTDTAGPSHSLSSLGDPALGDIIANLSHYPPRQPLMSSVTRPPSIPATRRCSQPANQLTADSRSIYCSQHRTPASTASGACLSTERSALSMASRRLTSPISARSRRSRRSRG